VFFKAIKVLSGRATFRLIPFFSLFYQETAMQPIIPKPRNSASRLIQQGFVVNTDRDEEFFSQNQDAWSDLNTLKDSLAHTMLGFVIEVERITSSPEVMEQLQGRRAEFDGYLQTFYADVGRFSETIQSLRAQHEGREGRLVSMEDLTLFTRLSMEYQTLQVELQSLLAPTLGSLVLLLHEQIPQGVHSPEIVPDHVAPPPANPNP
jgi:hypothetical protein